MITLCVNFFVVIFVFTTSNPKLFFSKLLCIIQIIQKSLSLIWKILILFGSLLLRHTKYEATSKSKASFQLFHFFLLRHTQYEAYLGSKYRFHLMPLEDCNCLYASFLHSNFLTKEARFLFFILQLVNLLSNCIESNDATLSPILIHIRNLLSTKIKLKCWQENLMN